MTMLRIGGVRDAKQLIPDCLTNPNLKVLSLSNSDLEDGDMELLAKISLHSLEIEKNPKVTDKGVHFLTKSSQLTDLDLMGTSITPACMSDLAKFKNLRFLRLSVQNWKKIDLQKLVSLLPGDCRLLAAVPDGRQEGFRGIDWQKELN